MLFIGVYLLLTGSPITRTGVLNFDHLEKLLFLSRCFFSSGLFCGSSFFSRSFLNGSFFSRCFLSRRFVSLGSLHGFFFLSCHRLFDGQADTSSFLVDLEDLGVDLFTNGQLVVDIRNTLVADFRNVDQTVEAGLQLYKATVFLDLNNFALDDVADIPESSA